MTSLRVEAADLGELGRDLKAVSPRLAKNLRTELKAAADPVAGQVRSNASWSQRIPGAVGVRVSFTSKNPGVSVFINRVKAPHARPLENDGREGYFEHPIPNSSLTVRQPARPFFFEGTDQHMPEVERAAQNAMDEAARAAGFR